MDREALPDLIRTARLHLRPWELHDVDDVFSYARDEEWGRYLHLVPSPYERVHAEQFVARQVLLNRLTHPSWAIVLDEAVIGGINVRFEFVHRLGELGYSIARRHWNRGYMTEVVKGVIDMAFSTYADLNRIRAFADVRNEASQRSLRGPVSSAPRPPRVSFGCHWTAKDANGTTHPKSPRRTTCSPDVNG